MQTAQQHCSQCGARIPSQAAALQNLSTLVETTPEWELQEGAPSPLGVSWIDSEQAYNFALHSGHADGVTLLFFREDALHSPNHSVEFDPLHNKSGPVWHCRVPVEHVGEARFYAYRVKGPHQTRSAFDSEKLLLDPYAQSVYFPSAFDRKVASVPGPNMGRAPLCRIDVCRCPFDWEGDVRSRHGSDLIVYEMHVRGFTRDASSGVADEKRGTFSGVVEKIPHLKELGITAVELMPVFQFDPQDGNYWGYMPLNFFSPHHRYSTDPNACEQFRECREMIRALHAAGIEVILDVVYNHTCEGNHRGPTYSFRGIDDRTYYIHSADPNAPYANYTGCGNTLNTADGAVRRLIIDSLRYWVREMHVDGFRFDLASILSRNWDGSINLDEPPIFSQIAGDPDLSRVRLIAEPWDAGGLDQLGRRFPGTQWLQWNGRYRDTLQRFVRGEAGLVSDLMTRLYGSSDLFSDDVGHSCRPWQSVNYVTSHDGFTLYDLVSYNHKRNWANGESNLDGTDDFSWNCGWEGDESVPSEVLRLRKQQVKNFCCLLMLSNGTPMFRMGDEFLQTQAGNNNPYNQDNETSWLDWRRLDEHGDVFRFFRLMIAFRKAHSSLARSVFWREDIHWYGPLGPVDMSPASQTLAFFLGGRSQQDSDLYVMINAGAHPVCFGIHKEPESRWKRFVDTSLESPLDIARLHDMETLESPRYTVAGHSVVVLVSG